MNLDRDINIIEKIYSEVLLGRKSERSARAFSTAAFPCRKRCAHGSKTMQENSLPERKSVSS